MVSDRQGILKGDLNRAQADALVWLMNKESGDAAQLERIRLENLALASNPVTNPKLIEVLMKEDQEEAELEEYGEIEWMTPTTPEEMDEVLSTFKMFLPLTKDSDAPSQQPQPGQERP